MIQVKAGGEYAGIQWTRTPIALNISSDELVDFQQTFVRTVTSKEDWGLYTVNLLNASNSILAIDINFVVFNKSFNSTIKVNFTMDSSMYMYGVLHVHVHKIVWHCLVSNSLCS